MKRLFLCLEITAVALSTLLAVELRTTLQPNEVISEKSEIPPGIKQILSCGTEDNTPLQRSHFRLLGNTTGNQTHPELWN